MKHILAAVLSALAVTSLYLFRQEEDTHISHNLRENDETDRFLLDSNNGTPRKVVVSSLPY